MKKEFLIFVVAGFLYSSCSSTTSQQNGTNATDTCALNDSITIDPSLSSADNQEFNSDSTDDGMQNIKKDPFTSVDRQLFDACGDVSELRIEKFKCDSTWGGNLEHENWLDEKYTFDKKGMVSYDPKEKIRLSRNEKGFLTKKEVYVGEFGIWTSEEYVYNEQGMLDTLKTKGMEWGGEKSFQYDKYLNCISSSEPSVGEGTYTYTNNIEYFKIVEWDSHGNWTKRQVKVVSNYSNDMKTIEKEEVNYRIETRSIAYYE